LKKLYWSLINAVETEILNVVSKYANSTQVGAQHNYHIATYLFKDFQYFVKNQYGLALGALELFPDRLSSFSTVPDIKNNIVSISSQKCDYNLDFCRTELSALTPRADKYNITLPSVQDPRTFTGHNLRLKMFGFEELNRISSISAQGLIELRNAKLRSYAQALQTGVTSQGV
jgi:hypothetical protein